jgi:hypothetical protein
MTLNLAANISSILGLVISIFGLIITITVAVGVSELKKRYIFMKRVPEIKKDLRTLASQVSFLLHDYSSNTTEIILALGKVEKVLISLKKRTVGIHNKPIAKLIKEINICIGIIKNQKDRDYSDAVRNIYTELEIIIFGIGQLENDFKLEGRVYG